MEFPKTLFAKITTLDVNNPAEPEVLVTDEMLEELVDYGGGVVKVAKYQLVEFGEYHIKSELVQGLMTVPGPDPAKPE